ncbi:putative G-protein coupled receptor 179 [Pterocles gutturalis]
MGPWRWPLLCCLHTVLLRGTVLTGGQRPQEGPPQPAGWSPAPSSSWAPTAEPGAPGDPEGSAAALAFLQTGDAQRLARANCSRGVTAGPPGPGPPPALRATLRAAPEALAHAANFLNMLFQSNDIREASVAEDVEWYQALVRSLAEGHPWVRRAVLALDAHPLAPKPRLMLQATKRDGDILLQDISGAASNLGNLSWDNEWFNAPKSQRNPPLRKRVLSNDLRSMDTPKWQRGDSYVGEPAHVRWSPPFLECRDGRFLPAWAVTLSAAFYGLKPDLSPEFKGVVRVDIELRDVAIDQCASGSGWFADTHRCDLNSTQCVPQESRGFVLGRYLCRCKPGFYGAGGVASGNRAGSTAGTAGGSRLGCRRCRQGCATCEDDSPCLVQEDGALRAAVLSCQACCMLAVFLSMLVSYHFRRSKRIRASGVVLLEMILFGSLLLYFPVFILYFKPSIFRCIVLRWVRMLGFAIVYGTITLKLYRVLKVFLSRTAQRVPYVSSGWVLKMLGLILLLVLWFLAAWTVGMLENVDKNLPLVIRTQTAHGLHFYICGHDRWDYMMVIAELLFLLWGSSLCFATRAVPSAFHEPRYMGIALHNELLISAAFHLLRFIVVPSLHPDWTLLLFFAHTHGTITMTLALLFIPKFLHAGSPLREEIAAEVYEDELDMRRSGSCLTSSIASAWSEHSLDPDDIREELKKLYTQLELHKTRRMAANNPHLPKKRASRRSLGRSIARRLAELPDAAARRTSAGDRVGTATHRSSAAKRSPNTGDASLRDDSSRCHAVSLRKSRSTEGPAQEPQGGSPTPGSPAVGRKMMVVTGSEPSDSESLDAAPLVCKSASAHNLGGPGLPPPPRAPPLQKSLSVVTGAREEALLAASRAAREEWQEWHPNQHPSSPASGHPNSQRTPREARKPTQGPPPAEGCSQDMSLPGDGRAQKHVTYAPIKSISVDGSQRPGRVRVAVRRTPPPPPVRYQSLGRHTMAGDSPEPPAEPPAPVGTPEGTAVGTAGDDPQYVSPPAGKGRLPPAAPIPAQVCPWELVQEEILSRRQKATEAADLGTPGDAAATPTPSMEPPSRRISLWGLGLAIKAFSRSRGKSIRRGRRESEGTPGKRGRSQRERHPLAETATVSLGGTGRAPAAKSPAWSRQRPSSEPPARPWQGDAVPCQHNNNAVTAGDTAGWGDSGAGGQRDSLALGTGDGEKGAEEPSAPQGDGDAGGGPETPAGVHEVPPSAGHQEGAECPHGTPVVAGSGKAGTCPREGTEGPAAELGKDAPAAITGLVTPEEGVAGTIESKKATVCPWEGEDEPAAKSEICPWEEAAAPSGKERAAQDTRGTSKGEKKLGAGGREDVKAKLALAAGRPSPRRDSGIFAKLVRKSLEGSRAETKKSPSVESIREEKLESTGSIKAEICPWESLDTEQPPAKPRTGSPALPKSSSKKSQSAESLKAEVCPWDAPEAEAGRAEICPWESLSMEQPLEKPRTGSPALPKSPSKKSQSVESLKAEVCPWDAPEVGTTDKAEICPWEAVAPPSDKEKPRRDKAGLAMGSRSSSRDQGLSKEVGAGTPAKKEKMSRDRASICPWESLGTEQPLEKPHPGSPALPKSPSKKSQSAESLKAEVCPWDAPQAEAGRAEICPWESTDTGGSSMGHSTRSTELLKPTPKELESVGGIKAEICPWESLGTEQPLEKPRTGSPALPKSPSKKSQSTESLKAEVCPWDAPEVGATDKAEICPWEVAAPPSDKEKLQQDKAVLAMGSRSPPTDQALGKEVGAGTSAKEKVSRDRESICPWESPDMEQPPAKPRTGSPALPKSPSKKSQSAESLKAEVCPWDAPEAEAGRAEICPWESTDTGGSSMGHSTRSTELLKPSPKELESVGGIKAEICPWESLGTEQPLEQPFTRSPALPKSPSKKSQSTESLKAEVCPWDAPEAEAGRAEICPWEVAASLPEKGAAPGKASPAPGKAGASEAPGKGSSEREAICPWESPATEEPSPKTATEKETSKKSESLESRRSDLCPWEAAEPSGAEKESSKPSMHPQGAGRASSMGTGKSGASAMPPTAPPKKSKGRSGSEAEHKPLCRILPSAQPRRDPSTELLSRGASTATPAGSTPSPGAGIAEVCPWEAEEAPPAPSETSTDPRKTSEVCPWELESGDPTPTLCGQGRAQGTPGDGGGGVSDPNICPWDHE